MTDNLEELERLLAKATGAPWQYRDDYTTEGFVTIVGNVDGEYDTSGGPHYTYEVVCRCEDEFGERLPNVAANVRSIVALRNAAPSLIATAREVERLRHALVTAMIPIEAILLSGADAAHCQDVRDALHDARNTAKAALESKGG